MEDRPEITIQLKPLDTAIEVTGYVLLGLLWAFAIYAYWQLPDNSSVNFDLRENPNNDKIIFLLPLIGALQFLIITSVQDKPHLMNFPLKITPDNIERQYALGMRMAKMIKVILATAFLSILYYSYYDAIGLEGTFGAWLLPVIVFIVFLPLLYCYIKSKKS